MSVGFSKITHQVATQMTLIGVLILSLATAAHAAPTTVTALTLKQALDRAMESYSTILTAREKITETDASKWGVISKALPNISADVSALVRKDAASSPTAAFGGESYNYYDASVTAIQPLFTGGTLWGGYVMANRDQDLSQLNLEIVERDLSATVVRAFYQVMVSQKRVESLAKTKQILTDMLTTAERRFKLGIGKELEVLQVKTRLALLESSISQANVQLKLNIADLARLTGVEGGSELQLRGTLAPLNWEAIRDRMSKTGFRRPELDKVETQVERFSAFRRYEMAEHWPHLNFVGTVGRSSTKKFDLMNSDKNAWSVGLQLNVPLFTGLSSVFERQKLASQEAQLDIELSRTRQDMALEHVKAASEIEQALAQLKSTEEALSVAQRTLKLAQGNYRSGTATFQQVSDTQKDLLDAELAYENARFDFISKVTQYFVASGWPLRELIAELEKGNV